MFEMDHSELSAPLYIAWRRAGRHIHRMSDGSVPWLKMHADAPPHEHLIFRIGNRLFFVFVEVPPYAVFDDVSARRLHRAAGEANGVACVMPMRPEDSDLAPAAPGWGLVNTRDGRPINPPALVDDELVEMSAWELLDFATLIVRTHIDRDGGHVFSWHTSVRVDPSMCRVAAVAPNTKTAISDRPCPAACR